MEVKIENIIKKLKKEGVEGAQKEADELVKNAQKEASKIVSNAQKEAESMIDDARKKSANFEENSKLAIQQAARDGELLLKHRIQALFDHIFKKEIGEVLKPEFIKKLILKITEQWGKNNEVEIVLSKGDRAELEKLLFKGIKKELKKGITIKASADLSNGFHIGLKGDDVYYDFSDESITEILRTALNPQLNKILDIKNG